MSPISLPAEAHSVEAIYLHYYDSLAVNWLLVLVAMKDKRSQGRALKGGDAGRRSEQASSREKQKFKTVELYQ